MRSDAYTQVESRAAGQVETVGVVFYGRVARDEDMQLAHSAERPSRLLVAHFEDFDDRNRSCFGSLTDSKGDPL